MFYFSFTYVRFHLPSHFDKKILTVLNRVLSSAFGFENSIRSRGTTKVECSQLDPLFSDGEMGHHNLGRLFNTFIVV